MHLIKRSNSLHNEIQWSEIICIFRDNVMWNMNVFLSNCHLISNYDFFPYIFHSSKKFIKPWWLYEDKNGCIPQTLTAWHAQNEGMTCMHTHIQQGASFLLTFTLIRRIYVSMPCLLSVRIDLFTFTKVLENLNLQ